MSYTVLPSDEAFWRPSNQMGVLNTDLAKQLGAADMGARLWRVAPGQASTRHRHLRQTELYVVLQGTGRIRVGDDVLTLDPLSTLLVGPNAVRQMFNDTKEDAVWLVVGTPAEAANTLEMPPEQLAMLYPDGPKALPSELEVRATYDMSRNGENCTIGRSDSSVSRTPRSNNSSGYFSLVAWVRRLPFLQDGLLALRSRVTSLAQPGPDGARRTVGGLGRSSLQARGWIRTNASPLQWKCSAH